MAVIIYCKSHHRRPIRLGYSQWLRDPQGEIPVGWCSICGREVFHPGNDKCSECCNRKGESK